MHKNKKGTGETRSLTMQEILDGFAGARLISGERLPGVLSLRVFRLRDALLPHCKRYEEARDAVYANHGGKQTDDGTVWGFPTPAKTQKAMDEIRALAAEVIEVLNVVNLDFEGFTREGAEISPDCIAWLSPFWDNLPD